MKNIKSGLLIWGVIMALAVFGCSSSKKAGTPDTKVGSDKNVTKDSVKADTPADINLDIPPEGQTNTKCTTSDDCKSLGDKFYCNCKGFCIEGNCEEDKNCGSASYCGPCDKKCHIRVDICKPCEDTSQCTTDVEAICHGIPLSEGVASQPVCLQRCMPNGHCPGTTSYQCSDVGEADYWLCVPLSGDCGQLRQCARDSDCKNGKICHPDTHMCIDAQCDSDLQCGYPSTPKVCAMGRCIDACSKDETTGKVSGCDQEKPEWASDRPWLCEDGHCKIKGACFSPTECTEAETYCDLVTHKCMPGCKIDIDCKDSGKICFNGKCIDKGCTHNYECSFGQVCEKTTGKCEDAPDIFCKTCTASQQDKSGDCGDSDTMCLKLQDKDGNDIGSFCFPPCAGDPKDVDTCPQGYQCAEIQEKDQSGNVKNTYHQCFRNCNANKPPEPDKGPGTDLAQPTDVSQGE